MVQEVYLNFSRILLAISCRLRISSSLSICLEWMNGRPRRWICQGLLAYTPSRVSYFSLWADSLNSEFEMFNCMLWFFSLCNVLLLYGTYCTPCHLLLNRSFGDQNACRMIKTMGNSSKWQLTDVLVCTHTAEEHIVRRPSSNQSLT